MKERLKYFQDMFVPFLANIDITKLKGIRIKYRHSRLETSEFDCDMIEIVSTEKETNSKYFLK